VIRQRFLVSAPVAHALDIGASPPRFRSFVPLLKRVESTDARIDHPGAKYTMVFGLLGLEVTSSWEVEEVRPADLGSSPRPDPPWEIVEVGRLGGIEIRSTTRYEATGASSIVSHIVTFAHPAHRVAAALQLLAHPAARVGMGVAGRRFARYAGSRSSR